MQSRSRQRTEPRHVVDSDELSRVPFGLRVVLERDSYGFDVLGSMPLVVKGVHAFVSKVELGPNAG